MVDFIYTPAKQKLAKATLDFDIVDLRAILCMSDTTASSEQDAASLAGITTLDEYDGTGYTRIDFAGLTVTQNDAEDRSEIYVDAGTFGATVDAATRAVVGLLYYVRVNGTAANDYPVAWKGLTPPFNGTGTPMTFTPNAAGILWVS